MFPASGHHPPLCLLWFQCLPTSGEVGIGLPDARFWQWYLCQMKIFLLQSHFDMRWIVKTFCRSAFVTLSQADCDWDISLNPKCFHNTLSSLVTLEVVLLFQIPRVKIAVIMTIWCTLRMEFPTQMASNDESVSMWWRHYGPLPSDTYLKCQVSSFGTLCDLTFSFRNGPVTLDLRQRCDSTATEQSQLYYLLPRFAGITVKSLM